MRITRLSYLLVVIFLLSACRSNMICPAYQSTYILDMYKKRSTFDLKERTYYTTHLLYDSVQLSTSEDSLRRQQFSHFIDSLPFSRFDVRKNKKGRVTRVRVAKNDINREAYKRRKDLISEYDYLPGFNKALWYRKNDDQRLIDMKDQFIPPEDTTTDVVDEGFFVAEDFVSDDSLGVSVTAAVALPDSLATDSVALNEPVAALEDEEPQVTERYRFGYEFKNNKFNEDQDYYNKEYGHLLVMKVQPPPPEPEITEETSESDTTAVKKKGFMSRFKNKKKKKKEEAADGEEVATPDTESEGKKEEEEGNGN